MKGEIIVIFILTFWLIGLTIITLKNIEDIDKNIKNVKNLETVQSHILDLNIGFFGLLNAELTTTELVDGSVEEDKK